MSDDLKRQTLQKVKEGNVHIATDSKASPTGFPFKVVDLIGSLSEDGAYENRVRQCNLGYLRHAYKKPDGSLGYRCPAENVQVYVDKGGLKEDTVGRKCLCNSLLANIGLPDFQNSGEIERPLVTAGYTLNTLARFLKPGMLTYKAADVIRYLLSGRVSGPKI